jgi:hypothetical protein
MDPRRMSGLSRVDPQVPVGSLTVRCLLGGFDQPAVGVTVKLAVETADGATQETREATTVEAGRATFDGLEAFVGGTATASVDFGGEVVGSQPIPIDARAGSRVMLVKGAASTPPSIEGGGHGAPPNAGGAGAHGGSDVPLPGQPFALADRPAGTIIAGTLDLDKGAAVGGIEVALKARTPDMAEDAEPISRQLTTNEEGRAVFEGLLPPEFPEGTKFWLEAKFVAEDEPKRSAEFSFGESAIAVVLTKGDVGQVRAPTQQTKQPKQRRPTLPPRPDSKVPAGTVTVKLIDGDDAPVAGHEVQVFKKDVTGDDMAYSARTGANGIAVVEGVKVQSDAFYFAAAMYDGGPYQSSFFQLPDTMGATVELRVFPITTDRTRIRSGAHFEVRPLENDSAQVVRIYELLVEGEEAFWQPGGMRLYGAPGARFVKVMPGSMRWLEEKEEAPYAVLNGPIAPGEVAELSIAYVVDTDGTVGIDWKAPFPLIQTGVALEPGLELTKGAQAPPETPPHMTESPVRIWKMNPNPYHPGPCELALAQNPSFQCPELLAAMGGTRVELEVSGLPTRPSLYRTLAIGFGCVIAVFAVTAMVLRPRVGRREALVSRREELLRALDTHQGDEVERARIVDALDRVFRQLEALEQPPPAA